MKFSGLKARMILLIGSVVVLGLGLTIGIITYRNNHAASAQGIAEAQALAQHEAADVEAFLNRSFETARTLATTYAGLQSGETALDREAASLVLLQILTQNPEYFAVWTCWEPNAFDQRDEDFAGKRNHDQTGRFIPYWFRKDGIIASEALKDYVEGAPNSDFYQIARQTRREVIMEPYRYEAGGKHVLMTSLVVPIIIEDKFVGVTGIDIDLAVISTRQSAKKIMGTGYAATFSHGGLYVSHPKTERLGDPGVKHDPWLEAKLPELAAGREFIVSTFSRTLNDTVFRIAAPIEISHTGTPWSVIISIQEGTVLATTRSLRNTSLTVGAITLLAVLGVVLFVATRIAQPVRGMSEDLQAGALQATSASAEIARASQTLAATSSQQAAALEETSASLEELASMTQRNSEGAHHARTLADATRTSAETGGNQMKDMVQAMNSIKASSDSVAKIIKTIDEIAFQTNILALNAAVEAARAGESGAGFAVVAEEVRALAQRSATAARETTDQISASLQRTNHGVAICSQVAGSFDDILGKSRELNTLVAEIATASEEQTTGIGQIKHAVSQMDKTTQSTAGQSEETAAAAEELSAQAVELQSIATRLFVLVEGAAAKPAAESTSGTPSSPPAPGRNAELRQPELVRA
ncbi:Methyl-accepting chemotaxis protein IV [Lacunisphaera limnophila]|uniref:Methyl-accepting chemotaxis protein IV n=1 Tax=Lacunisphaera limnophila TaxID=1838286 RepID=A0A1D8AS22_9BACT|nr:methyl-accepting chemotaxis protein [Lacunisphaera limnophila]AOS43688.1 Methyl-accepting chemotaxis protein IV [Lacunisphaera limnophila]